MLHLLAGLDPRHRERVFLIFAGCLLGLWLLVGDYDLFRFYRSYSSFTARQATLGYAFAGRFGRPQWPAVVVGRIDGDREIAFTLPDGQRHIYGKFPGHLKVLTLRSSINNVFVLVCSEKPKPVGLRPDRKKHDE